MTPQSIEITPEVQVLIDREVARGGFANRSELLLQAVEFWAEHREAIAAIEEGLDQIAAGQRRDWEQVDSEFRQRNGLPLKQ